jgi:ribonuclease III
MMGYSRSPYKELETAIGYRFSKRKLLEAALMHRSFRFENEDITTDNQRLEFLGDAILGFVIGAHLYEKFGDKDEGFLTSLRSQTTSGKVLAELAAEAQLGKHIKMGRGEELSGGRERASNLADGLEAVIAAAYFDGGLKAVQKIFKKLFVPRIESLTGDVWADNPKGRLQEYAQRTWKAGPRYRLIQKHGPPHAAVFTVSVDLPGGVSGTGTGSSKREAETHAAMQALCKLNVIQNDEASNASLEV